MLRVALQASQPYQGMIGCIGDSSQAIRTYWVRMQFANVAEPDANAAKDNVTQVR